jgi:hypothetical protein
MQCVEKMYKTLLRDSTAFSQELHNFVCGQQGSHKSSWPDSLAPTMAGMLTLLEIVFEMLNDVGLCVVFSTYAAVKRQETIDFEPAHGWNVCCFSRLPCKHCVHIGENLTANFKYLKWLQCLWIVTHLNEIENCRSVRDEDKRQKIPQHVCEIYRSAFLYVLEELELLYDSVRMQDRVTAVFVQEKLYQ